MQQPRGGFHRGLCDMWNFRIKIDEVRRRQEFVDDFMSFH